MNIQRLIDKYEGKRNKNLSFELLQAYIDFIRDLEQLDEPKPVKIPQFVAEKIDYFKKTGDWDLFQAMDYLFGIKEIREWLEDKNNQETFARAWLDGYEVEKEKKYIVTLKSSGQKLYYHTEDEDYIFSSYDEVFYSGYHTKTDLEENDMSWVFDCPGMEIQEVE
ncbi:DUF1642 domain-containing protein [Streptococcus mitis]|uniref:DUF1642 domain-containing protein n=1 Tax=Streptococcus mitis TaxID=28037 RepID=UPI002000E630|nr:DUF1642 domain-containing protein [Streptococcus mitis]